MEPKYEKSVVFKEYHLWKIVVGVMIVVGLVIYYIASNATSKDMALQTLILDVKCTIEKLEEYKSQVSEIIDINEDEEVVEAAFSQDSQMLSALLAINNVEVFLMDKANYEKVLGWEVLYPLNDILSKKLEEEELQDNIKLYKGEDGKIYGFSVMDKPWIEQFEFESSDDVIFGIVNGSPNMQNAITLFEYILQEK